MGRVSTLPVLCNIWRPPWIPVICGGYLLFLIRKTCTMNNSLAVSV
jgi:hypothetical protein